MAVVVLANHGHPVLLRSLSRGQHLGGRNGSPLRQEKGSYAQERHRASSLDKAQQSDAAREAVREWTAANGANIDVHARQFTPSSFKKLILSLGRLGYISMMPVRAYPTPVSRLEFCAVLEKP